MAKGTAPRSGKSGPATPLQGTENQRSNKSVYMLTAALLTTAQRGNHLTVYQQIDDDRIHGRLMISYRKD